MSKVTNIIAEHSYFVETNEYGQLHINQTDITIEEEALLKSKGWKQHKSPGYLYIDIPNPLLNPNQVILTHFMDILDKVEREWEEGEGFYDDYNGVDDNGESEIRNTESLIKSLKQSINILEVSLGEKYKG